LKISWLETGAVPKEWFDTREIVADRSNLFYGLPGPPGEPFDTGNGRRRFGQAFLLRSFGRHFSREANASEHRSRLHIYGVVEWQTKVLQLKGFPTLEEVENADKERLARWYRFLPSGETASDQKIMKRIAERFDKLGGMTAELSKKIGM
jgi:hypothetical protein